MADRFQRETYSLDETEEGRTTIDCTSPGSTDPERRMTMPVRRCSFWKRVRVQCNGKRTCDRLSRPKCLLTFSKISSQFEPRSRHKRLHIILDADDDGGRVSGQSLRSLGSVLSSTCTSRHFPSISPSKHAVSVNRHRRRWRCFTRIDVGVSDRGVDSAISIIESVLYRKRQGPRAPA
jgi:hypothetical protein